MATCKKCKREFISLEEASEECPACQGKEFNPDSPSVLNQHLKDKQKRLSSE